MIEKIESWMLLMYLRVQALAGKLEPEHGMSTAEYAIGTLAAAAIAGVLLALAKSSFVRDALMKILKQAFSV